MVVGFWGCVVGVGLRFGWGSCKLFILLPVGERLGLVPRCVRRLCLVRFFRVGVVGVFGGLRTQ